MTNEIDIKVGKTYPIKHLIEELKKYPDIKLGHIFVLNAHEYRLGVAELDTLQKRIENAERNRAEIYDIAGKRRINPFEITILDIMDPYLKYKKYEKFYEGLYKQIESAIEESPTGAVLSPSANILEEARKEGLRIEKDRDLFDGMAIYFDRGDMDAVRVVKEIPRERKEFEGEDVELEKEKKEVIVFGRKGKFPERAERRVVETEKKKLPTITGPSIQEIKENTKEFEPFYSSLEADIAAFIKSSKDRKAAVKVDNIISEAKNTIPDAHKRKDILLKGLIQYYKERGMSIEEITDEKGDDFLVFKGAK